MRRRFVRWLLGAGSLLLSPSLSLPQDGLYLDSDLEDSLRADLSHLQIDDLSVQVIGRMATLEGSVESLALKKEAGELARRKQGVVNVVNDLEVVHVGDAELKRRIADELRRSRHYTIYDEVEASVEKGVVTLEGRMPHDAPTAGLLEDLSKIRGLRSIRNEIRVLPYSLADGKLQEAVAVEIYAAFRALGQPPPPLHVVAEGGLVTLSGVVDDERARKTAEEAARRTEGVSSVANRLRVGRCPATW